MKYALVILIPFLSLSLHLKGQSDHERIRTVLNGFIEGTSFNYPEKIISSFYPETQMFLHNDADTILIMSAEKYASLYTRKKPGTPNWRYGSILSIDIERDIASAKIETLIPSFRKRFVDIVLLKKIDGDWKIISKAATAEPIPVVPEKIASKPVKEVVMKGLNHPWSMAFLSENEAIIAEKDGDLIKVNLESKTRETLTGLPKDVARKIKIDTSKHEWGVFPPRANGSVQSYNAGWFQVLLDPDFKKNSFIYISYAAENDERASAVKVVRATLAGNKLTKIKTLFLADPYSHGLFHYGGGMIFGADGKLYISTGERNLFEHLNPVLPLSQDKTDKRGKIIRINSDGTIPDDNPDFGPGAVKGLYAMGIRATQGFALNPQTNQIWFSEHGTIQGDEINLLLAGANYGWPHRTSGKYRSKDYNPPVIPGTEFTDPVYFWEKTVAPTGLCFYKGREFPDWNGNLIVPGLSKGSLWRITLEHEKVTSTQELFINDRVRLRKAVMSPQGKLYVLTDEDNGKLIRIRNEHGL
ncbi:MAG: PQQ-dependent sugar dehydrogenase [Bacteroidota bacterium]